MEDSLQHTYNNDFVSISSMFVQGLPCLLENQVHVKALKFEFYQSKVGFLVHIITQTGSKWMP